MNDTKYTLSDITEPDDKYTWFQYNETYPFEYDTVQYSSINAIWLVECARLVYVKDNSRVSDQLLNGGFDEVRYFDRKGTQAFVAVNEKAIIIAFRGTEPDEFKDIKTDLNIVFDDIQEGGKVHKGFLQGLNAVWVDMEKYILSKKDGRSIWWCGHSLGGALATIAASKMGGNGLYTFGSPRVGNSKFAKRVKYLIPHFRFVHNCDIVPRVPPLPFYRHSGRMTYIAFDGTLYHNAMWWRRAVDRIQTRIKWVMSKFKFTDTLLHGVADHSVITYSKKISKSMF